MKGYYVNNAPNVFNLIRSRPFVDFTLVDYKVSCQKIRQKFVYLVCLKFPLYKDDPYSDNYTKLGHQYREKPCDDYLNSADKQDTIVADKQNTI